MPDVSWCIKGGSRGYVTTRPLEWWIGKYESGWRLTVAEGRQFESSILELKYKSAGYKVCWDGSSHSLGFYPQTIPSF